MADQGHCPRGARHGGAAGSRSRARRHGGRQRQPGERLAIGEAVEAKATEIEIVEAGIGIDIQISLNEDVTQALRARKRALCSRVIRW